MLNSDEKLEIAERTEVLDAPKDTEPTESITTAALLSDTNPSIELFLTRSSAVEEFADDDIHKFHFDADLLALDDHSHHHVDSFAHEFMEINATESVDQEKATEKHESTSPKSSGWSFCGCELAQILPFDIATRQGEEEGCCECTEEAASNRGEAVGSAQRSLIQQDLEAG